MMWNFYPAGWFWPVCIVAGLVLLSLGIILFSRWFSNNVDQDAEIRRRDSALDIAQQRFARGEITAGELAAIRQGLSP